MSSKNKERKPKKEISEFQKLLELDYLLASYEKRVRKLCLKLKLMSLMKKNSFPIFALLL